MGGPSSLEGIEPFLYKLFSDRQLINFEIGNLLQNMVAKIISKIRVKKIRPFYKRFGGCSPQISILYKLASKIENLYRENNSEILDVKVGFCYSPPFIEDNVSELLPFGYNKIFVTTLYPQYSYTTSGICFKRFFNAINILPPAKKIKIVNYWYNNSCYNRCLKDRILEMADLLGKSIDRCHILFSAHSLPLYTVTKGDLYIKHIENHIKIILDMVKPGSHSIGYQSKTKFIKWLGPSVPEVIDRLYTEKIDNIIVVPISFVSDHIETLMELDEVYINNAQKKGLNILRIKSLNDSDDFARSFIDIIESD